MGKLIAVMRWLFGLFYVYVGGSWFIHWMLGKPWVVPEETPSARVLTTALSASGIVDPLIAATCLVGGLLLLIRRTAPLGIVVLFPLVAGIFLFHLLLNDNAPWGTFHFAWLLLLAWWHRAAYRPLWNHGVGRTTRT